MGQGSTKSLLSQISDICFDKSSEYGQASHTIDWWHQPNAIPFKDMKSPIVTGIDQCGRRFYSFAVELDLDDKKRVWTIFQSSCKDNAPWHICGTDSFRFMSTAFINERNSCIFKEKLKTLILGDWILLEQEEEPRYVRLFQKEKEKEKERGDIPIRFPLQK